jgi:predicted dehydrogenase
MSQHLRLGLIGCGDFGKELGRYFQQVADIAALCDVDEGGMETTARELNLDVPRFTDYQELLADGELDAVAVTAANFVHAEITVAAARAGLHVFCEKAMARTVPECWEMVCACRANGVKLMIGHKRRLRPPWARMIELTDDALLGEVLAINVAEYCDNRPYEFFDKWWSNPALSGGFFHMHGVHVIDWLRAMCGDAERVTALYGPQHDERYGFPDIIHATFQTTKTTSSTSAASIIPSRSASVRTVRSIPPAPVVRSIGSIWRATRQRSWPPPLNHPQIS